MTHKTQVRRVAEAHGWTVRHEPKFGHIGVTEYRRPNGRKVAYVRVMFGVTNQVVEASWADNASGYGGRQITNRDRDKLGWVLRKLEGEP